MRTVTLHCPRCGRTLTVSAAAPPRLTCPTCLARVENPGVPPELPLPVIPLENEVRGDSIAAGVSAIALALILLIGALLAEGGVQPGSWSGPLLLLLVVAAVGGAVVTAVVKPRGFLGAQPRGAAAATQFILGLIGGVAVAAVLVFHGQVEAALWLIPLSGLVLSIIPSTRALGAGLLVSIGLSVLILVGLCFAALAGMH